MRKYEADSAFVAGTVIIHSNPGAGVVVDDTSPEGSLRNMHAFVADLLAAGAVVTDVEPIIGRGSDIEESLQMGGTRYQAVHDGRFAFRCVVDGRKHLVEMPGNGLDEVRFVDGDDQNIWDFPRVFIDGSSWVWSIGLRVLHDLERDATELQGDYGEYLGDK